SRSRSGCRKPDLSFCPYPKNLPGSEADVLAEIGLTILISIDDASAVGRVDWRLLARPEQIRGIGDLRSHVVLIGTAEIRVVLVLAGFENVLGPATTFVGLRPHGGERHPHRRRHFLRRSLVGGDHDTVSRHA